jgi:hypothetical protein
MVNVTNIDKINSIPINIKIEDLILKLDKLVIDFNADVETYNGLTASVKSKVDEFDNTLNLSRNIYVDNIPLNDKSEYLGCYKNTNTMTYTGDMDYKECRANAIDLKQPFFSVTNEDGYRKCYVGDDLNEIIRDGQQYKKSLLWQSSIIDTKDITVLKILNSTFAIVDSNNKVLFSNDVTVSENELQTKTDERSKLILSNDGNLKLIRSDDYELWRTNQNLMSDSITAYDWVPTNNPTNKYKRSYMNTNEFLDINESISSENGKYIMEFTSAGVMKLYCAENSCVKEDKFGNIDSTALHMIHNTLYDVENKTSSNGNNDQTFFNTSLGDCMNKCQQNPNCKGIEYIKSNIDTCTMKSTIGEKFKSDNSILLSKNENNFFDDKNLLGKLGYIDENDILHEYPKKMISYNNEYSLYNKRDTGGKEIGKFDGDEVEGIMRCNEMINCAGFVYNKRFNTVSLRDDSIYPVSDKFYSSNDTLYKRKFEINSHKSCERSYESVNVDLWRSYEILNKVTTFNEKTHKCGVTNYIDNDIEQIKIIIDKLNSYTVSISSIIKQLIDMNVGVKEEVLAIQERINKVVSNILKTKVEEGFNTKENCINGMNINLGIYKNKSYGVYTTYALIGFILAMIYIIRR